MNIKFGQFEPHSTHRPIWTDVWYSCLHFTHMICGISIFELFFFVGYCMQDISVQPTGCVNDKKSSENGQNGSNIEGHQKTRLN